MKISLIIAFYKNIIALELILKALQRQSYTNFEVVIAEDDNNPAALAFITEAQKSLPLQIKHVHQDKDDGFRKNQILNKAIKKSSGEFLVFLDGDCIPHKHFLKAYVDSAAEDTALFGRRVMLSEPLTQKIYQTKDLKYVSFWPLWTSSSKYKRYGIYLPFFKKQYKLGIYGCNWGIYKKQVLAVNGFDEDYITAGVGEDNDIEWRLVGNGMKIRSIRYSAIEYHLHHPFNYGDPDTQVGYGLLRAKMEKNKVRCENGLEKL